MLRKHQNKMLEMKTMITEMKNTFNGLVSKLDIGKEKNQGAWRRGNRNFWKWKVRRMKNEKSGAEYPPIVGQLQKVQHIWSKNIRRKQKIWIEEIFEITVTEFLPVNVGHHTTIQGAYRTSRINAWKMTPKHIIVKLQSTRINNDWECSKINERHESRSRKLGEH